MKFTITPLFTALALFMTAVIGSPINATSTTETLEKRVMTGRGTFYWQEGVAGSCRQFNSDDAFIAALGWAHREPHKLNNCGRRIWARSKHNGPGGGRVVEVTVADTCPGCAGDSVDFSFSAFQYLTDGTAEFTGNIPIEWDWI